MDVSLFIEGFFFLISFWMQRIRACLAVYSFMCVSFDHVDLNLLSSKQQELGIL